MINKLSMKFVQVPLIETDDVDEKLVHRSLSWQPDGRCYDFTRGAILLFAPPTSGVYGLVNLDSQIFIGESENIREALLRHESEPDFQSRHLRPTGFTFELCVAEKRKSKTDQLIARYHPLLQTEAALIEAWSLSNAVTESDTGLDHHKLDTYTDHGEFPLYDPKSRPKVRPRLYLTQTRTAALAEILVASAAVILYLGIPISKSIQKRGDAAIKKSPAVDINRAAPGSSRTETGLRLQNDSSIDPNDGLTNQSAQAISVKASASTSNAGAVAAKSASATDRAGVQAKTTQMDPSTESFNLGKKWSVQISAAPAKDIADSLVQRLKANGYDGYVVQAEVKEKIYYRVRVGHFETREKAESVRQLLARQAGYRDAYLTSD